jgi:sugar phosphate isomerase/epimerase
VTALNSSRLAVCSWSLQPANPAALLDALATIGIRRVQLALDPLRENPAVWGDFPRLARESGVTIVSGMFGTLGEDYSTLETIKATGGVVPDATWETNWRNIQEVAAIAARLGLKTVTFHAGFLPHEESDPAFAKLLSRIEQIAALFARHQINLGFETGQETAVTLATFLRKLNRPNVGVNFDPANMLLYDKGDPIDALRTLGPWLKQCHIKDARRTRTSGTWEKRSPSARAKSTGPHFSAPSARWAIPATSASSARPAPSGSPTSAPPASTSSGWPDIFHLSTFTPQLLFAI